MLITNFASGELSPTLNGRVDLQQYYQAASRIDNFDIIPTGGIKRRTGFKRLGKLSGNCRIIPFVINSNTSYILEITPGYIYFWKNGERLLNEDKSYFSIEVPCTSVAEINEIHYAQNYDTLIFVHKNYNPYTLNIDIATEKVTFTKIGFTFVPEISIDDDYSYILKWTGEELPEVIKNESGYPYCNETVYTQGLYCTFNGHLYKCDETKIDTESATKECWEIYGTDPEINTDIFTTENNYPAAVNFYNNRLWLAGSYNEPQKVHASAAPDTEGNRYFNFATYKKYITVEKTYKNPDLHIFSGTVSASNKRVITAVTQDFTKEGALSKDVNQYYVSGDLIKAGTKVVSITSTTITIDTDAIIDSGTLSGYEFTIQLWKDSETATEDDREYVIANNNITTSDCSFNFEIASEENDAIKFLSSNKNLVIGTESTVWAVPNSITALNIVVENQGKYGSSELQALAIDKATVFFAQGKKGIREFYYDSESEAFRTNNIAILAEHLLQESAVIDFDYINNPYNKLILVREDGTIAALLYDKNNGVMAWYRYTHGNLLIKSCAVTLGDEQNDLAYFVVKDDENFYLERLDSNDEVYLDSWKEYDGTLGSNDDYNKNAILFNVTQDKTCNANDIPEDFIASGDTVYIGYNYTSDIISMPVIANDPTGKKRITSLIVRFLSSYMPTLKCTGVDDEEFYDVEQPFSGIKTITYPGSSDRDVYFEMVASLCHAVTILSVNATLSS